MAWSPRLLTKASREPSGDHSASPFSPRMVLTSRLAGADPSTGTTHSARSFSKTTRSPLGASTGLSPSPIATGSPPSKRADQICSFGGTGVDAAFTGVWSSQLPPWSPPRT